MKEFKSLVYLTIEYEKYEKLYKELEIQKEKLLTLGGYDVEEIKLNKLKRQLAKQNKNK